MSHITPDSKFIYHIDHNDRLIFVDEAWLRFALENDAPHLTREAVVGQNMWQFISDPTTAEIYKRLLDQVRSAQSSVTVPFRCDSPTCRRYMSMDINPLGNGAIQFRSRLLTAEERIVMELLNVRAARSEDAWIKMCSWCKKVEMSSGIWVDVEQAVQKMNLFGEAFPPEVSHGICPDCLLWTQTYFKEFLSTPT